MLAVVAAHIDPERPLAGLQVGDRPEPQVPDEWTVVRLKAAALNHHDLWTLRGVGISPARLPIVLGCDGAGVDDRGREVIIHAVIGSAEAGGGDETLDPSRSLLSERHDGTLAERIAVPKKNLVPKPAALTWEEAACLPTAWLTAYRMVFSRSGTPPGGTLLVQGAGGGVATAAIRLASAAGYRVFATSRDPEKRKRAQQLGARAVFEPGARLPERVDAVIETVGEATWAHSLKAVRPGGTIVVSGATSGPNPPADLARVFFLQIRVVGSTMGTREELGRLVQFCETTGVRPVIDSVLPLAQAREGFGRLAAGEAFGKIVLTPD